MSLADRQDLPNPDETWVEEPEFTFGLRLRALRKGLGYGTQAPMAKRIGVRPSTYAAWEADREEPQQIRQMVKQIQQTTGCDPAWLLGFRTGSYLRLVTSNDGPLESSSDFPKAELVCVS